MNTISFTYFDAAEFLDSEEMIAAYLTEVLAENDPAQVITALGTIARARGMTKMAQDTGLGRESLYKSLRPGATPAFETISKIVAALGVKLTAEPVHVAAKAAPGKAMRARPSPVKAAPVRRKAATAKRAPAKSKAARVAKS